MKILGFDTETTGLDTKIDEIAEVGLVLWDADEKQPVRITGCLVKTTLSMPPDVSAINGITPDMVNKYGLPSAAVLKGVLALAKDANYFCAHNAPFDKGMLETWCVRENMSMPTIPWIDTATDLPAAAYQRGKSASLKYMACDHGFLYEAHRAVNDVLAMFRLLSMYDINEIIRLAQTPNVMVRAVVSYDDRLKAKERGFYWKPEAKLWVKQLKADRVDAEKAAAPFPVVLMETAA